MEAPLRVTACLRIDASEFAGVRLFRMTERATMPNAIVFRGTLPIEGRATGAMEVTLPAGMTIAGPATFSYDPTQTRAGAAATFDNLTADAQLAFNQYIEDQQSK